MDAKSFPPTPESFDIQEKVLVSPTSSIPWETVAARRRDEIQSKIPQEYLISQEDLEAAGVNASRTSGILNLREQEIVEKSATDLLELLHSRQYTSVEVTTAFCKSAALAHQLTNCLAWVMFEEALAQAASLDDYIQVHGQPIGPLHGLPLSVKEHVYLKDTPSTSAFIAWADDVASEDALMVKIFREAGAVFHVKTTNPQGLMALETESNLYGTTKNPYNTALTSGGSSGGESALIAMKGSPLGIGTDIGGSIRVPSAFCGIYGLKPSVGRLPHGGLSGAHGGMENIIGAVGPMARTVEDMALFCKVALQAEPWLEEPPLVEIPWKGTQTASRLIRIGVMYHDGVVNPHPPVARALSEAVAALQQAGHEIVEWNPSLHLDLINTVNKLYFLDGGKEYHDIIEAGNETTTPLTQWILEKPCCQLTTSAESWKINQLRNALQISYASQWNASKIDVLLCPANASVASAHTESTYWGYSSVFNILDYSAATFPVSFVKETDTWENFPRANAEMMSEEDKVYEGYFGNGEKGPKKYEGAPVPLQLVGRRFTEEKLLGMLGRVVEDLKSGGVS